MGKSRLVEEFLERAGLPHVFFTAVGGSREEDLAGFAAEVAASPLPDAARFSAFTAPLTWDAARTNNPEIDIVGADRAPIAKKITLVGSVKWLERKPFDDRDLARLVTHRSRLPGADDTTPLLAVTRNGCTADVPSLTPEDLHHAWT
uniref:DUF234 domain-containing protein n=1 Tax=Streptomyces sp. NBC_00008 TaxID=2903610 RepID=A0AAU2VT67_9ACTN